MVTDMPGASCSWHHSTTAAAELRAGLALMQSVLVWLPAAATPFSPARLTRCMQLPPSLGLDLSMTPPAGNEDASGAGAAAAAAAAAEQGAQATVRMGAGAGRSSYVPDHVLRATPDPGATAAAVWIGAVARAMAE